MAYSDFTLSKVRKVFGLQIEEHIDLFANTTPVSCSDYLAGTLEENLPLAIAINTEKARSELIIMTVLLEIRRRSQVPISLFSGSEFNVDLEKGLGGFCDYLISKSKEQLTINVPIVAIVEAKNENIKGGLGQCVAEMFAAQLFNHQEENDIQTIYGAVTTGELWKFLKLVGNVVLIDLKDYYINDIAKILGILLESTT